MSTVDMPISKKSVKKAKKSRAKKKSASSEKKTGTKLWKKGESGNPKGRPKGSKNKTTELKLAIEASLVEASESDAMDIYQKTVELAKLGDTTCIKILMDRLWPVSQRNESKASGVGGISINITSTQPPEEADKSKTIEAEVVEIKETENG